PCGTSRGSLFPRCSSELSDILVPRPARRSIPARSSAGYEGSGAGVRVLVPLHRASRGGRRNSAKISPPPLDILWHCATLPIDRPAGLQAGEARKGQEQDDDDPRHVLQG